MASSWEERRRQRQAAAGGSSTERGSSYSSGYSSDDPWERRRAQRAQMDAGSEEAIAERAARVDAARAASQERWDDYVQQHAGALRAQQIYARKLEQQQLQNAHRQSQYRRQDVIDRSRQMAAERPEQMARWLRMDADAYDQKAAEERRNGTPIYNRFGFETTRRSEKADEYERRAEQARQQVQGLLQYQRQREEADRSAEIAQDPAAWMRWARMEADAYEQKLQGDQYSGSTDGIGGGGAQTAYERASYDKYQPKIDEALRLYDQAYIALMEQEAAGHTGNLTAPEETNGLYRLVNDQSRWYSKDRDQQTGENRRFRNAPDTAMADEILRQEPDAFMTAAQRQTFNYLASTKGMQAAERYYNALVPQLEEARTAATQGEWAEFTQEHPYIATGMSTLMAPAKIPAGLESAGAALFGKKINPNSTLYQPVQAQGTIRQIAPEVTNWTGNARIFGQDMDTFLYGTITSALDSTLNAAIGGTLGRAAAGVLGGMSSAQMTAFVSKATSALMGAEMLPDTIIEEKAKGRTDEQAVSIAIIRSLIEGITEKYSIESFLGDPSTIGKVLAKSFVAEGGEEIASNWLNDVVNAVVADPEGIGARWRLRRDSGENSLMALAEEIGDSMVDDVASFLAGGLSGIGMTGAHYATGVAAEQVEQREAYRRLAETYQADPQAVVAEALEIDGQDKLAQKAQDRLNAGKSVSDRTLATLMQRNDRRIEKTESGTETTGAAESTSADQLAEELYQEYGETARRSVEAEAQPNAQSTTTERQTRQTERTEEAQAPRQQNAKSGKEAQQRAPARQRTAYVRPSNGTPVAGTDILRVERSEEGGVQLVRTDGSRAALDDAKTAGTALEVLEAAKQLPEHSDPLTLNGMLRAYEGYLAGKPSNTETAETFFDGYTTALYAGIEGESRSVLSEITEDSAMQRAMADGYSRGVEIAQGQALAGQLGSAGAAALEEYGYRYAEQFGAFYQAGQEGLSFRDAQRMTNMLTMGESRKAEMQAAFEAGRKDGTEYETYKDDLGFEEDRGGGEPVSLDSSERAAGVGAGEPAGELGEGAERAAVSAKALGLENGTDRKTARVLRATELTEEMWGIKRDAKKHGMDVQFIEGYMEIRAGNRVLRARGAKIGNQLIVQTDNLSASFYEIYRHERLHGQIANGEIELEKAVQLVRETIGEKRFAELLPEYRKAYAGVYSGERFEQNAMEELCADAAAGLIPGVKAVDLSSIEEGQKNSAPAERGTRLKLVGMNDRGIEVYQTSKETMALSWKERKAKYLEVMQREYFGRTARFERNGHTYYATFDQNSVRKPVYGDRRSTPTGVKAIIKAGADGDIFNLLERGSYDGSRRNVKNHTKADYFDYFVKTVQIDGKVFDLMADIEKDYGEDGGYVYTLALRDNKKIEASPAHGTSQNGSRSDAGNASLDTVAQDKGKSQEGKTSIDVAERDETYRSAVESGDMETAQKMVEEAAKAAGYDSPMLYHGTKTFGFTEFDLAKMDDKRSIFATSKQEVAQTYSGAPGTRRISETARNIEEMDPKETVDALNDYAKRYGDGLDSKYTFITPEEAAKISSNADAALNELSAVVREKIAEYADRMAADFNEKDMKTQEQLVGLQEKLYLGDRYSILTPLYLLINHTDAFSGSKVAADALQKLTIEREVKKRSLDTSNGFVLRDELGGYIYVPMTTEAAKDILRDYGSRGNYALVAKTGRTLEVNAAGQRWNELRNWTKGAEYDVKDTFIDKEGDRVYLLDRNTDDVITSTDLSGVKETLSDTSLHMLLLNKANSAMRIEAETIRDTRGVSAWAARNGYDSVIFHNLIDSGGNADLENADTQSDVYIIFDPASVKSADPVTYDDSGNVIPLSERFNPGKRDIRYSVSEEAEPASSAEYAQMQSGRTAAVQAQEQKKRQETLYSHMMERSFELGRQFTEGTQKDVNTDDLPGIATDILRFAGKNAMSRTELEQRLEDIAMKTAREYSPMEAYETAKAEADALAADMIRNASGQTSEMAETWNELRSTLRSATSIQKNGRLTTNPVRLAISGQNREDLSSAGGYESMRKRLMGYAFLSPSGTPVEEFYQKQLSPKFPEYFPASIQNPADQLIRIVDVLDRFRQIFKSPYMGALAEDTAMLSQEIVQRLYNSNVAEPGAEAFAMQHEDMLRAHYENKLAEARTQMQQEVDSLRQLYENNRTARQEQKDRDALLKIAQRLDRVKVGSAWKAKAAELVGNLDTIAKSMTGRTIIGDRIGNLSSEGIETVREDDLGRRYVDIETLKDWVKEMQAQNPDFMPDQRTMDKIDRLNKVQIADMEIGDVRALLNAMQNLENEMRTSKKLLDAQDRRDVAVQTAETISDIQSAPPIGGDGSWSKLIVNNELAPVRFLHRITGYKDDSPLYRLGQDLENGQTKMLDHIRRAQELFSEFTADKKFMASLAGKESRAVEITGMGRDGKAETLKITPSMQIIVYLASFDNNYVRHVEVGGFEIPDYARMMKGDTKGAWDKSHLLRMRRTQMRAVQRNMTEKELQFAHMMQKYWGRMSPAEVNEVSRKLLGYDVYGENLHHVPIETSRKYGKNTAQDGAKHDGTLEGGGQLKARTGAVGPVRLRGATEVLETSIDFNAKYIGMAIPIRNFGKIYGNTNWTLSPVEDGEQAKTPLVSQNMEPSSVQAAIAEKWSSNANEYLDKLLVDIQSPRRESNEFGKILRKVESTYAGSVLTLPASTALAQMASYPTAAATIGWGPLAKAMTNWEKVNLAYINKYTPLLWHRSRGFETQDLTDLASGKKKLPKGLNWVQGADVATTKKLWKAAEYYVRKQQPELEFRSEAFGRATAEVYNRIIYETQPNYTPMERGNILRSADGYIKPLTIFKTQPFQNFNILYDAIGNAKAKEQQLKAARDAARTDNSVETQERLKQAQQNSKEAKRNIARAISSQLIASAVFAGFKAAVRAFFHKTKKYENEDGEVTLASFLKGYAEDVLGTFAGSVILGNELYAALTVVLESVRGNKNSVYYGIESMGYGAINDLLETATKMPGTLESIIEAAKGDAPVTDAMLSMNQLAVAASKVIGPGIPLENIEDILKAVSINTMEHVMPKEEANFWYRYYTQKTTAQGRSSADKSDIYAAYRSGNTDGYQSMRDAMKEWVWQENEQYKSGEITRAEAQEKAETSMNNAMAAQIKDEYMTGGITDTEAADLLQKIGGKDKDKAAEAVAKWHFQRDGGGKDASAAQASAYYEFAQPAGISMETFKEAWDFHNNVEADKDSSGKSVPGSAKQKVVDYIRSLGLSKTAERALWNALKGTWSDKDTPWA